jgi:Anti-sigma factor NepR
MSDDSEFDPHEWLLAIGRRLRADYDALKEPVPERLAALVKQLETETARTDDPPRNTDSLSGDVARKSHATGRRK